MKLIQCDETLIKKTAEFASDVFIDYYKDLIGIDQAEYMVNLFLTEDKIKELIDKGAIFKILVEDDQLLAFTEYIKETDKVFLSKLYVRKDSRKQGLGKILFEDCIRYTKENNLNKIYLTVNKHNTPSYNTYLHLGFKVVDSVINDIGNNYVMDDYIMEYQI